MSETIARLAEIVLPPELGIKRDHIVPEAWRGPGHDARYDFHTLVYDNVYLPERGMVALFCPKLLNFRRLLARADIRLDGRRVRARRIRKFRRYDVVELPARICPVELSVEIDGWRAAVPVNPAEPGIFAGMNCLMTLSRNNALPWIRDWAEFHVREHGAEAVVFMDNGSDAYGLGDIAAALAEVSGLKAIRVLGANRPYGPVNGKKKPTKGKFLQAGVTNIARWRYFGAARAVLVNDIDELFIRRGAATIFDATVASRAGYLKVRGEWRLSMAPTGVRPRHRDHVLVPKSQEVCPAKYCVVPDGRLRNYSWGTHNLDRLWFSEKYASADFGYFHCRSISDLWKRDRGDRCALVERIDEDAVALFERVYGPDAGERAAQEAVCEAM